GGGPTAPYRGGRLDPPVQPRSDCWTPLGQTSPSLPPPTPPRGRFFSSSPVCDLPPDLILPNALILLAKIPWGSPTLSKGGSRNTPCGSRCYKGPVRNSKISDLPAARKVGGGAIFSGVPPYVIDMTRQFLMETQAQNGQNRGQNRKKNNIL